MKNFALACTAAAIALTLTACNQAPPDTHDADVKAISDTEAQWNQSYQSKDAAKVAVFYSDDAILMLPGMAPAKGKDAIQKALQDMVADPALSLQFHATRVDVAKSGELGYTQGAYTLTATDRVSKQLIHDHGSYITTYRKQADGSWKAVTDIASSEVRMPALPPPAPTKPGKK